jgi:DNA-binding transcriptional ArsR family regulator
MQALPAGDTRWQLYRLLSDPTRLKLLALSADEELSVGELAELLGESQPNVSRHAAPLRQAGLLADRRQGTRTLIRLADGARADAVVADALEAGKQLCEARTREFFARPAQTDIAVSPELPSYLFALAALVQPRELALDAGTGDGVLLDLLAPVFRRVVAIDRSDAQLSRARQRVLSHGYDNVELLEDQIGGAAVAAAVGAGADLVVASRVLHHAPRPRATMQELAALARPGGRVLVIDYARHEDELLQELQADVWLGFAPEELEQYAAEAGLSEVRVARVPGRFVRTGADAHLPWLSLLATRPVSAERGARPALSDFGKNRDSDQENP